MECKNCPLRYLSLEGGCKKVYYDEPLYAEKSVCVKLVSWSSNFLSSFWVWVRFDPEYPDKVSNEVIEIETFR